MFLQKDGFETEFEVVTDDAGKLKAMNVTSADGSPCPGPEPRKRRPKKSASTNEDSDDGVAAAAASGDEDKENGDNGENGNAESDKPKKPRRRRGKGGKKAGAKDKPSSWEADLDDKVQKAMENKALDVNGGRAFLAIGDARVKLGTDGYAALAHSSAILAEGKWTVVPSGKVTVTWEKVLKLSGDEWTPSTFDAEKAVLVTEMDLADGKHGNALAMTVAFIPLTRFAFFLPQTLSSRPTKRKRPPLSGERTRQTPRRLWKSMAFRCERCS